MLWHLLKGFLPITEKLLEDFLAHILRLLNRGLHHDARTRKYAHHHCYNKVKLSYQDLSPK